MRVRGRKFELNKADGKFLGVCSGIADVAGIDATIVRVALVIATLMFFPWPAIAYFLAAWLGRPAANERGPALGRDGAEAMDRLRDLDRRMAAIDSYVASPNRQLANEIDRLR